MDYRDLIAAAVVVGLLVTFATPAAGMATVSGMPELPDDACGDDSNQTNSEDGADNADDRADNADDGGTDHDGDHESDNTTNSEDGADNADDGLNNSDDGGIELC